MTSCHALVPPMGPWVGSCAVLLSRPGCSRYPLFHKPRLQLRLAGGLCHEGPCTRGLTREWAWRGLGGPLRVVMAERRAS